MNDAPNPKVSPCPFCNSIAWGVAEPADPNELTEQFNVICFDCFACGPDAKTSDEAIIKWNNRTTVAKSENDNPYHIVSQSNIKDLQTEVNKFMSSNPSYKPYNHIIAINTATAYQQFIQVMLDSK